MSISRSPFSYMFVSSVEQKGIQRIARRGHSLVREVGSLAATSTTDPPCHDLQVFLGASSLSGFSGAEAAVVGKKAELAPSLEELISGFDSV